MVIYFAGSSDSFSGLSGVVFSNAGIGTARRFAKASTLKNVLMIPDVG